MSETQWGKLEATLSHKNACKEFGLAEELVIKAIKEVKLLHQINYAYGNPYFKLLRTEVEAFALKLHGDKGAKEQQIKHKLQIINKEINNYKRKIASLEKQQIELLETQK